MSSQASAAVRITDPGYYSYDGGMGLEGPSGPGGGGGGGGFSLPSPSVPLSFDGISQVTVRGLHSNFSEIPPDTMGAVGRTQFMEVTNGAYAVYDKTTGAQTKLWADGDFWSQAGQPGSNGPNGFSNGDTRILFDSSANRWVAESFGASIEDIQIAVSNTADATGGWKSVSFKGFSDGAGTGVADYPTLAIDKKAIYIGTNNFTQSDQCITGISFCGTTLNVIARNDIFKAGGPTVASLSQFNTPLFTDDAGFAIQGVNQVGGTDAGRVQAISIFQYGPVNYSITNPGGTGSTQTASNFADTTSYNQPGFAAQPDGSNTIDALDDRFSSAVWEFKGKIYSVHTITPIGSDHSVLEYYVIDAATNAVIQKGTIGDGVHDFFQGSITVNYKGQVVFAYNESGSDMNISFLAQQFNPVSGGNGAIAAIGAPILLHVSPIDNYHNGSPAGSDPAGRQRWGDYAQITVDPNDPGSFWAVGEYALGYLPNPTASFSRWGTWISDIKIGGVPEPTTWSMMLMGFGGLGAMVRRRRRAATATA
jgi:hypothetical protein